MGKAVMGTGRGRGGKGGSRASRGQEMLDSGFEGAKMPSRDPVRARQQASAAGQGATVTPPMDNGIRAMIYAGQRGGLAPVLTDTQRRRLRKRGQQELTRREAAGWQRAAEQAGRIQRGYAG